MICNAIHFDFIDLETCNWKLARQREIFKIKVFRFFTQQNKPCFHIYYHYTF